MPINASAWASSIIPILRELEERRRLDLVEKSLTIPGDFEFYIQALDTIVASDLRHMIPHLQPGIPQAEISQGLANAIAKGQLDDNRAGIFESIIRSDKTADWNLVADSLGKQLQIQADVASELSLSCLRLLLLLCYEIVSKTAVSNLERLSGSEGHIFHYLHKNPKDDPNLAYYVLPIIDHNPHGNLQEPPQGTSLDGKNDYFSLLENPGMHEAVMTQLSELCLRFRKVRLIISLSTEPDLKALSTEVIGLICRRADASSHISPDDLIEYYPVFESTVSQADLLALISSLDTDGKLASIMMEREFSPKWFGLYTNYLRARDSAVENEFNEYLNEGLRHQEKTLWLDEFQSEGRSIELLTELIDQGRDLRLSTAYKDALLEHAKSLLQGRAPPAKFTSSGSKLLAAMPSHLRETFLRDLRDELIISSDQRIAPVISLYGSDLMDPSILEEGSKADDITRKVFSGILYRLDPVELAWLAEALDQLRTLEMAEESSRKTIEEEITEIYARRDLDKEAKALIETMGESLKLDLISFQPSDEEQKSHENGDEESGTIDSAS